MSSLVFIFIYVYFFIYFFPENTKTGLLVMCPLLDMGFHLVGWRNSYRVLAGIYLLTMLPLCMFMKPPGPNYHCQITDTKDATEFSTEKGKFIETETKAKLPKAEDTIADKNEGAVCDKNNARWKKYVSLMCLPQHWFYFFGTLGTTLAAIFNNINLVRTLTFMSVICEYF